MGSLDSEATVDRAFTGRELEVICPYDQRVLPAVVELLRPDGGGLTIRLQS